MPDFERHLTHRLAILSGRAVEPQHRPHCRLVLRFSARVLQGFKHPTRQQVPKQSGVLQALGTIPAFPGTLQLSGRSFYPRVSPQTLWKLAQAFCQAPRQNPDARNKSLPTFTRDPAPRVRSSSHCIPQTSQVPGSIPR